ncbi:hypothetical protein [Curtobacterium sp. NPDC092190]|uniref:hypothetical protein n=1 Tax=Curtobacterium sp. NPDC092190 TaxID=3363973 RepID=UPI003822C714
MNFIDGFAFRGFRSFPSGKSAELYSLSKINLVAGQNNAGKSNVLRVIASTFAAEQAGESTWDRSVGDGEHRYVRSIHYPVNTILSRSENRFPRDRDRSVGTPDE